MTSPRIWHTATLLSTGKVLVAGGMDGAVYPSLLAIAELYDEHTDTWAAAAAMNQGREMYTATLLADGKVLVAGGTLSGTGEVRAELYDPATDRWSYAGAMSRQRYNHAATLIDSGKVLVVGGKEYVAFSPVSLASAELYDPTTTTWTLAAPMATARDYPGIARLANGKILVAGGFDQATTTALGSAEIYDPVLDSWSPAGSLSDARYFHTLTVLPSGHVLAVGGIGVGWGNLLASAEIYDPATNAWRSAGTMSDPRSTHTATLLGDGTVLVAGGESSAADPIYDEATNRWSVTAPLNLPRDLPSATLLPSGKVLVAGGDARNNGREEALAELYGPSLTPTGGACRAAAECASGFCANQICCDRACDGGPCEACSVAAGAPVNGICALLTGQSCDDHNLCTRDDVCRQGICVGHSPPPCTVMDRHHGRAPGTCDPSTGLCVPPSHDPPQCRVTAARKARS